MNWLKVVTVKGKYREAETLLVNLDRVECIREREDHTVFEYEDRTESMAVRFEDVEDAIVALNKDYRGTENERSD